MKIKLYSERAIAVHGCSFGLKLTDAQYKKLSDLQEKWIYVNYCGDYTLPAFLPAISFNTAATVLQYCKWTVACTFI